MCEAETGGCAMCYGLGNCRQELDAVGSVFGCQDERFGGYLSPCSKRWWAWLTGFVVSPHKQRGYEGAVRDKGADRK